MQLNSKNQNVLLAGVFLFSSQVFAVDLVGVHDLAAKNDPQLKAAAYRKEATGENERQAWSSLLPSLNGGASMTRGDSKTSIAGRTISDSDIDNEAYQLDLRQSLYAQSNYEQLDIARGQVSQADAIYNIAHQDFLSKLV
jgi:outer membrane protein TolC